MPSHTSPAEDKCPTTTTDDDESRPDTTMKKAKPKDVDNGQFSQQTIIFFPSNAVASVFCHFLIFLKKVLTSFVYSLVVMSTILVAYSWIQRTISNFDLLNFCDYPLISGLGFCQTPTHFPVAVKKDLDFTTKLEEIQTLAVRNSDLPQSLAMGELCIHSMIIQVNFEKGLNRPGAGVAAKKYELGPVVKDFKEKVKQTINGVTNWLNEIDGIVDSTLSYSIWAKEAMEALSSNTSTETLRGEFLDLIEEVKDNITELDASARRSERRCTTLQQIRDRVAVLSLKNHPVAQQKGMDHRVLWDEMLSMYKAKIPQRPMHMHMCTHFYEYVDRTIKMQSKARFKIDQMKKQISALTEGVKTAPLDVRKQDSLRLYVDVLMGGVESLKKWKLTNSNLKARKKREVENLKIDFEK